jgi:hypothetical protein
MTSHLLSSTFILLPFSQPMELWAIEFRLHPVALSLSLLVKIALVVLFIWVYTQLRAAPVVSATLQSGHSTSSRQLAFILGIALTALMAGIMYFTLGGAAGAKAVEIARIKYGKEYKYHVTALSWSNGKVSANLTAYKEQEIKPVQVGWE